MKLNVGKSAEKTLNTRDRRRTTGRLLAHDHRARLCVVTMLPVVDSATVARVCFLALASVRGDHDAGGGFGHCSTGVPPCACLLWLSRGFVLPLFFLVIRP